MMLCVMVVAKKKKNNGVCHIHGFWYMSLQIILRVRSLPLRAWLAEAFAVSFKVAGIL